MSNIPFFSVTDRDGFTVKFPATVEGAKQAGLVGGYWAFDNLLAMDGTTVEPEKVYLDAYSEGYKAGFEHAEQGGTLKIAGVD